jgi:UDP-N-acetylmuramoylalanine-D-glutamate ligase
MKSFELQKKQVVVIGAGISGMAAAELLQRQGAVPFVSDSGEIRAERRARLEELGIAYEQGGHSDRAYGGDLLVVSPGVPRTIEPIRMYRESGRRVWTELELAWQCSGGPVVAVTGTNGKTTVTRWLGDLFARGGKPAVVAGNIGVAVSDVADQTGPEAHLLLEVSSYQLEFAETFRPDVSIILNITPDHMDYYGGRFEDYAAAKFRIADHQTEKDFFITNADDEVLSAFSRN